MSFSLEAELLALPKLGRAKLQERWRDLFKTAPPVSYTPDLLARGIAFRLQEKPLGELSANARRLLGSAGQSTPRRQLSSRGALRAGNRLVRRWRGRTYVVEVTEAGLVYDGERFGSLSVIARQITGTRWSGPKFFGLVA
jgi:Protein of unknown function (DUF2924)